MFRCYKAYSQQKTSETGYLDEAKEASCIDIYSWSTEIGEVTDQKNVIATILLEVAKVDEHFTVEDERKTWSIAQNSIYRHVCKEILLLQDGVD
ncbi:unnamed protein product [Sphenostylis stenocarpa]|uniref:Uncharacterized protein n=1 Tax=Sphenostylis stenocarpa TaxID=92480 RepID=A0AA86SBL1_9FABA|nr:unnamed protein product [Sphenostylis stenocarpa]